jgi:hypothetical protein
LLRIIFTGVIILAFFAPVSLPAFVTTAAPQVTQNFESLQGYLDAAPGGMDVRYAWTQQGGRGENVRIVDVEVNWNLRHNDLTAATTNPFILVEGFDPRPDLNKDHGAAVLGEICAADDGVGITGIANRSPIGLINPLEQGSVTQIAAAINQAVRNLRPGDVILIEDQSAKGPRFNPTNGKGLLPVEFEPDIFNAIKDATDRGIIVIEPAGNGAENLDDAIYNGVFNRTHDSGAIIVGAGFPPASYFAAGTDRAATDESNYGSRVDVQGWGRAIATCGFGDLLRTGGENNFYTAEFGATSGASAMMAGAAAIVQSIAKQRGLPPLTSQLMRSLFRTTGTSQAGNRLIGPRPDLRAAIAALSASDQPPRITFVKFKVGAGKLIVAGENFAAGDAVIEINGVAVPKMKYPSDYELPNGTTTQIIGKGNISPMLPSGVELSVTVYNRNKNRRSEPFVYRFQ